MTKTYIIKNGHKEEVDWYDFITNNNNPTLKRLGKELEGNTEFQRIMEEKGWNDH